MGIHDLFPIMLIRCSRVLSSLRNLIHWVGGRWRGLTCVGNTRSPTPHNPATLGNSGTRLILPNAKSLPSCSTIIYIYIYIHNHYHLHCKTCPTTSCSLKQWNAHHSFQGGMPQPFPPVGHHSGSVLIYCWIHLIVASWGHRALVDWFIIDSSDGSSPVSCQWCDTGTPIYHTCSRFLSISEYVFDLWEKTSHLWYIPSALGPWVVMGEISHSLYFKPHSLDKWRPIAVVSCHRGQYTPRCLWKRSTSSNNQNGNPW